MSTIKDVAKLANVSTATVSHVINNTRYVSDELKQRVSEAMEELGYLPNLMARGLRGGGNCIIGLIAPDFADPYFAEVGDKFSRAALDQGYSTIYCHSDYDFEKEKILIDDLISKRVDGIIYLSLGDSDEDLNRLLKQNIPVVLVDWKFPGANVDTVYFNFEKGGYLAAKHLLDLGHRKIACAAYLVRDLPNMREYLAGYQRAMKERGINLPEEYVFSCDSTIKGGKQAFKNLMTLPDPPTAICFMTDIMALGGMIAAYELNIKVPEDVSFIAHDNLSWTQDMHPPLTTIDKKITQTRDIAIDLLIKRIEGKNSTEPADIIIEPELIVRQSCAKPKT